LAGYGREVMKYLKHTLILTALTVTLGLVGCDRTVSKSETTRTSSDGSVKSKETTVKEKSDGTTVKTEETKKTTPAK
jgi:uncharacterized lipoprotein NlpE involved in copper resistance